MPFEGVSLFQQGMRDLSAGVNLRQEKIANKRKKLEEAQAAKEMSAKFRDTELGKTPEGDMLATGIGLGAVDASQAAMKSVDLSDEKLIGLLMRAGFKNNDPKIMKLGTDALKVMANIASTKADAIERVKANYRRAGEISKSGGKTVMMKPLAGSPFYGALKQKYADGVIKFKKGEIAGVDHDIEINAMNPMEDINKKMTATWWEKHGVGFLGGGGGSDLSQEAGLNLRRAVANKILDEVMLPTLRSSYPAFSKEQYAEDSKVIAGAIVDQGFNSAKGFEDIFVSKTFNNIGGAKITPKNIDLRNFSINKNFYNLPGMQIPGTSIQVTAPKGGEVAGGTDTQAALDGFIKQHAGVQGMDQFKTAFDTAVQANDEESINKLYQEMQSALGQ